MDNKNLESICKKYIDKFEMINDPIHHEIYKWEIAQIFQEFDVDADDFLGMLIRMQKASENLIDSAHQLPFAGLVEYARHEPETVREMFRALFADEHMDIETKQAAINDFIASSERLRQTYYPDSHLYVNNQRAVMMYLFLRYPNSNYGYKAAQAKRFADCIGFYEDWGSMTDFHLDIYSRMCEQVLAEIRQNEALLKTHQSRYEHPERPLHPDDHLHILLFDLIYSSQVYEFYDGITFNPINATARKLHFERIEKARALAGQVAEAQERAEQLATAKAYIAEHLTRGTAVTHKKFGDGVIEELIEQPDGYLIHVRFSQEEAAKKLLLVSAFQNGLAFAADEINETIRRYLPVLMKATEIPHELTRAMNELAPYEEYVE